VPKGVEVKLDGRRVSVKGPVGELTHQVPAELSVEYDASARQLKVARHEETRASRSFHGLHRSLISNMVEGCAQGFKKELEIYGTGYSVNLRGKSLVFQIGFCHEVVFDLPQGITAEVEQTNAQLDRPARFSVKGADKCAVGQLAANIRDVRPPEPYKGKGIRYAGEYVPRKEGKALAGMQG
jgi:large subunit ribosomal protein L6